MRIENFFGFVMQHFGEIRISILWMGIYITI